MTADQPGAASGAPAGVRWLVCGGRHYNDRRTAFQELDRVAKAEGPVSEVISGGAPGADALAVAWAQSRGVPYRVFKADWGRYGRAAGPIRNQRLLDEGQPDLVVAFPGSAGTADMVRRAKSAGVPTRGVAQTPLTERSSGPRGR